MQKKSFKEIIKTLTRLVYLIDHIMSETFFFFFLSMHFVQDPDKIHWNWFIKKKKSNKSQSNPFWSDVSWSFVYVTYIFLFEGCWWRGIWRDECDKENLCRGMRTMSQKWSVKMSCKFCVLYAARKTFNDEILIVLKLIINPVWDLQAFIL